MSETLSEILAISETITLAGTGTFGNPTFSLSPTSIGSGQLGNGTGLNNANQTYLVQITLAASATTTLSLYAVGGALDPLGNAVTMAKIKRMTILHQGSLNCGYVATAVVASGGTGYVNGDTLTVAGGTGTSATLTVTSVSGGVITGIAVNTAGSYTVNPSSLSPNTPTGGTGSSATITLTMKTYGAAGANSPIFTDGDYLTIEGGASNAWVSFLVSGSLKLYSGTSTNPGLFVLSQGGGGLAVASGSNEQLKFVNSGSNPITFSLYLVGATA
jgi:hypothetical protein